MLNISPYSVKNFINKKQYSVFAKLERRTQSRSLIFVLVGLGAIALIAMFLPWTQNIRAKGFVTTLNPYDKPQELQSLIGGRIAEWYVRDGQVVQAGDTIALIQEAKAEYLDPNIIMNTRGQQDAKEKSALAYLEKSSRLKNQILSLNRVYEAKKNQIVIKQRQLQLKIQSDSIELNAAQTNLENASAQLKRMEQMYAQGIKSLTDLETRKLQFKRAEAAIIAVENKILQNNQEYLALEQELNFAESDFYQKKAKIESEIQTAQSNRYTAIGETSKLQSDLNKLVERQKAYAVISPINGTVTKILKNGIGEFVKEQEGLATIVPLSYTRAVELYIPPNDMPLVHVNNEVRIQFDGWPAVVFSGWPSKSIGIFEGKIIAIDNEISENGKYRILVVDSSENKPWPELIRFGSGAKGLILLNDVRVYYEIWRQLNGFPPDFYKPSSEQKIRTEKAPIRKVK